MFLSHDNIEYYGVAPFLTESTDLCWRLIRKEAIPATYGHVLSQQEALMNKDAEKVPTARAVVCLAVLQRLVRNTWPTYLLHGNYVQSSTCLPPDYVIQLGEVDENGIGVTDGSVLKSVRNIGLVTERKQEVLPVS